METSQGIAHPTLAEIEALQATVARLEAELDSLKSARIHRSIPNTLHALLSSRKFLVLLFDTLVSILLYYQAVDPVLIGILQAPVLAVIGGIAHEDAAENRQPDTTVINNSFPTTEAP